MLVLTKSNKVRVRINPLYIRSYAARVMTAEDGVEHVQTVVDIGDNQVEHVQETPDQIDALMRLMGAGLYFIAPDGEPRRFTSQGVKASGSKPRSHAGGGRK